MDKYDVVIDGQEITRINHHLVKKQKISDSELDLIKGLHRDKLNIFMLMTAMDPDADQEYLKICDQELTELEFLLQDAWKFPRNAKFHRFWNRPFCECPKMDNNDAYPTGYYVPTGDCPLHGRDMKVAEEIDELSEGLNNDFKSDKSMSRPIIDSDTIISNSKSKNYFLENIILAMIILTPILLLSWFIVDQQKKFDKKETNTTTRIIEKEEMTWGY